MADYIERNAAISVADYAVDEHPYGERSEKLENLSEYNKGWNDACDCIRNRLETIESADVMPIMRCKDCKDARKEGD